MDRIRCHLIIKSKSDHLNQIYTGFLELKKKKIIDLTVEMNIVDTEPIAEVIVNDSIRIIYDTYDGYDFYAKNVDFEKIDYYFKRSFVNSKHKQISNKIYPLGLNYNVYSKYGSLLGKKEELKKKVKKFIRKEKLGFTIEEFEQYPFIQNTFKVCFLTRMWDPNASEVKTEKERQERIEINEFRASCIRKCKEIYKEAFIGGVEDNEFTRKYFKDCIVEDTSITQKSKFIDIVKSSDVCVATTGLHKSIGWKFAEYVAASRCIVTEKLNYELPENFRKNINYLEFSTSDELIYSINKLRDNKIYRLNMMKRNNNYYNNYVRADKLILNTLIKAINEKNIREEK